MGFRDRFKNAFGSGENGNGDSNSQEGTGNFKYLSKLMLDSNYVVLDCDIVSTGFEKRLFREGIPLLDNITIDGAGHTIDAQGHSRIFFIKERNITLKNITFKNGLSEAGGAISITDTGTLEIENCTFTDNNSKEHGGAIINFGNLHMENVDFINNAAKAEGGAINNQIGGKITLSNCSFKKNNSPMGGGAILNFGPMVIDESTFENNSSNKHAGAIYIAANGKLNISKTDFIRNVASGKGGAILHSDPSADLEIDDCRFIENRADDSGGAIGNWGKASISNSEFEGNFSKKYGYDINFQKGSLMLSNVKFNYPKERSLFTSNDDAVTMENCEFAEYDD